MSSIASEEFPENSVVCTGTHDNDTLLGWFESLPVEHRDVDALTKNKLLKFFKCSNKNIHWEIINYALSTTSKTVTIPLQDILGQSSSARFNIPGTLSADNWSWRMEEKKLTQSIITKFAELTINHKRNDWAINNLLKQELE